MANRFTVEFNAKIKPERPLNEEFLLCKCYVMALNKNRNLSYISKDAADSAIDTLYNIPVIGHLYVDEDGKYHMGGHDMTIEMTEDGGFVFKRLTVPYGVVPQQDGVHYEDVEETDGSVVTYLVSDVILWVGRYPELKEAIYDENGVYFNQSMEINVNEHAPLEEDKNYTNILNYSYSALCLLGKSDNPQYHVEPCFPSASVSPYEFSLDDNFTELMTQLKSELAFCFENTGKVIEMEENAIKTEEATGCDADEAYEEVARDDVDVPDENGDGGSDEEFSENDQGETVTDDLGDQHSVYTSTYQEKREAIENALPSFTEQDDDGRTVLDVWHWLCDFDDAYAYVERSEWKISDGYSETKGRYAYVFDEDNKTVSIAGEFEEMLVRWLTKEEAAKLEEERNQYEALVEYKASREKADREAAFDVALEEFEDLAGNEEFESVREQRYSYESVQAFKNACYIVRGKYSIPAPKRKNANEPQIPVGNGSPAVSLRERFHERYGKH